MSDRDLELYRQHREGQTRYVYFLMAAAGSGIVLAVKDSAAAVLHWSLIPLGAAVLAWGASAVAGILVIEYGQSITATNVDLLRAQRGELALPGLADPGQPWTQQVAVESLRGILETKRDGSQRAATWQLWSLLGGAACYVAWHVLGIVLRS
ncbi:MAG: hypothetical protein AB7R55_14745 [Gemmatimonadales bacterium]